MVDERTRVEMDADFPPARNTLKAEIRSANAAEYSAYQMGRIRKALERIADAVEKIAAKP